jgi:alanyl-tRNA synthetase
VRRDASEEAEVLAAAAEEAGGIKLVTARTALSDQDAMLQLAERVRAKLGDAAVVLGGAADGKVALVALFADAAVERGLSAATVVREAAAIVGGGGGGRDNMAQAGGRDPERLDDALAAARSALVGALGG